MISSEVQRTLVKSPPELWTELSDPDALARHLGELGEIRITRTEPEELVEWEADGTTGTVAIKPSAWGTKVTLTVSRELSAPEAPAQADDDESDGAPPQAAGEAKPDGVSLQAVAADEPEGPPPHTAAEGEANETPPDADADAEADRPAEAGADTPAGAHSSAEASADRKPAPATEAARRAAGWPARTTGTGPAIESDLRAAEEDQPAALPELGPELAGWNVVAEAHEPRPMGERAPEPRRGFFARLFGRRRPPLAPQPPAAASEPQDPLPVTAPASVASMAEAEPNDRCESAAQPLPVTVVAGSPQEHEPAPAAPEEPPATDRLIAEVQPPAGDQASAAEEPPEDLPLLAQAPDSESAPSQEEQNGPAPDLAAELRAAEEVAAEQVEAVLSAVLDRLGAAHHRPFSRA